MYWGSVKNTTGNAVTVTSSIDGAGLTVVLNETRSNSGIFEGTVVTADPEAVDSSGNPVDNTDKLEVGKDDTITVDYNDPDADDDDVESTLQVETTPPSFQEFSPGNGSATRILRPEVEVDVTDVDSGIPNDSKLYIVFATDGLTGGPHYRKYMVEDTGSTSEINNGFHIRQSLGSDLDADDATIYWWAMAEDAAGNTGVSDRLSQDDDGNSNPCNGEDFSQAFSAMSRTTTNRDFTAATTTAQVYGCQPYMITVDNTAPRLTGAFTGSFWDLEMELEDDEDDRTNNAPGDADPTSIRLEFDDDIDGSTVSADDFEVDGDVPIAAEHFAGAADSVFLTVPSVDPNSRPEVVLVGELLDEAGNKRTSGTIKAATDQIAPTLTVSVEGTGNGDRPVTDESITVTIVSDEAISAPNVSVYELRASNDRELADDEMAKQLSPISGGDKAASPVKGAARTYSAKIDIKAPGLYSVMVTATDVAGNSNPGTAGKSMEPVDVSDDTEALLFEVDRGIPDMTVSPNSIDDPDAFITLDFSAEGSEYPTGLNPTGDSVDYDSYDSVTIASAMIGDLDITDTLASNDAGNKFLYKASGLEIGEHTITVEVTDEAGNEDEFEATIEITEREPFSLTLNPGWNLVSIPSDPVDSSINSVIPVDHPATTVLTYDPSVPGGWLTALRGSDGSFSGTLLDISAERAYWVLTDSFVALKIDIPKPRPGSASFLPTVALAKGWNLVPILDVDGNFELDGKTDEDGDPVPTYNYFASVADAEITAIYTYNTVSNTWTIVGGGDVAIGNGYWVYADAAGTLVPQ